MLFTRLAAIAAVMVLSAAPALARDPLALAGAGRELSLSLEALRALPSETVDVAFLTSKGEETARYTGARLWDILAGNGLVDPARHGAFPRTVIVLTAGDGYTLALSAGELAPELGNAPVILAYARNGAPLAAGRTPRLIVPGDRRGTRNVFDIARIEVRVLGEPQGNAVQEKTP